MAAVKLPKAVRIVRAAKKQDVQNPMSEDLHWKRKKLEVQGPVCVMSRTTEAVKQPVPKLSETEKKKGRALGIIVEDPEKHELRVVGKIIGL